MAARMSVNAEDGSAMVIRKSGDGWPDGTAAETRAKLY